MINTDRDCEELPKKVSPRELVLKIKEMFDNTHFALSAIDIMQIKSDLENLEESDTYCICEGNLRNITLKSEPLLGKTFEDRFNNGGLAVFEGVMYSMEDYYYVFRDVSGNRRFLSCVADPNAWGFFLKEE